MILVIFFPANSTRLAIKGTSTTSAPVIHLSHACTTTNCITIPAGPFNVMLRGYSPNPTFIYTNSGMITLPTITRCSPACN